jgi:hypothetical protein
MVRHVRPLCERRAQAERLAKLTQVLGSDLRLEWCSNDEEGVQVKGAG